VKQYFTHATKTYWCNFSQDLLLARDGHDRGAVTTHPIKIIEISTSSPRTFGHQTPTLSVFGARALFMDFKLFGLNSLISQLTPFSVLSDDCKIYNRINLSVEIVFRFSSRDFILARNSNFGCIINGETLN
jgi:hypothetical protein